MTRSILAGLAAAALSVSLIAHPQARAQAAMSEEQAHATYLYFYPLVSMAQSLPGLVAQ